MPINRINVSSRGPLHYMFRRCSKPRQIVWCYTNYRYKPYLSHGKVRLLTALLNCQNCQFWQFDRDKRIVGVMFIIYRVLFVYVGVGLARWMCRHTFKLVRGRWRLKRAGGSLDSQLPVRKYCSTKVSRSMCTQFSISMYPWLRKLELLAFDELARFILHF
jgi:hypothetical protein